MNLPGGRYLGGDEAGDLWRDPRPPVVDAASTGTADGFLTRCVRRWTEAPPLEAPAATWETPAFAHASRSKSPARPATLFRQSQRTLHFRAARGRVGHLIRRRAIQLRRPPQVQMETAEWGARRAPGPLRHRTPLAAEVVRSARTPGRETMTTSEIPVTPLNA